MLCSANDELILRIGSKIFIFFYLLIFYANARFFKSLSLWARNELFVRYLMLRSSGILLAYPFNADH